MIIYYITILCIIGIDQLTKYLTVQSIGLYESIEVIPGVFSLTYHQNTGAAWSILEGQMWFFYIVTVIVVGFMLYYLHSEKDESKWFSWALTLLIGGALGNFIDRVIHQFVVDMLRFDFINFPIFNVADMMLTFGVVLMIIYLIRDELNNKTQKVE